METQLIELAYALDTFYFLVMGAFVMWMAAGFTMLESGLVRAKNTAEILTTSARYNGQTYNVMNFSNESVDNNPDPNIYGVPFISNQSMFYKISKWSEDVDSHKNDIESFKKTL